MQYKKVKTAVVGCGMISNIYIKNLKNMFSIIDLAAVGDRNAAAAETVRVILVPVSPSGTGKTFRSLTAVRFALRLRAPPRSIFRYISPSIFFVIVLPFAIVSCQDPPITTD